MRGKVRVEAGVERRGEDRSNRYSRWSSRDIAFLRKNYRSTPAKRLVERLKRPMASICTKAKKLMLFRDPAVAGRVSPTDNQFKKLSGKDRIYIAALLDGEGTIISMKRVGGYTKSGRWRTPSRITIVSIANTDLGLIEYIRSRLGGLIYTRMTSPIGRKPLHTWQVGGTLRCKQLLSVLYPYMREEEKKGRAREVISYLTPAEKRMSLSPIKPSRCAAKGKNTSKMTNKKKETSKIGINKSGVEPC